MLSAKERSSSHYYDYNSPIGMYCSHYYIYVPQTQLQNTDREDNFNCTQIKRFQIVYTHQVMGTFMTSNNNCSLY